MASQYSSDDEVQFTVHGQTVRGTIVGHGDATDEETYTVKIQDGNPRPGRYNDGEVLVEEGVAFVEESALN